MNDRSFRIAIVHATRTGNIDVISRTIESMRREDPLATQAQLGVFIDGEAIPGFIQKTNPDHVEVRGPGEMDALRTGFFRYFGATNVARGLRWASEADVSVISEDDFLLTPEWLRRGVSVLDASLLTGDQKPFVCLSHSYSTTGMFDGTGIRSEDLNVYRFGIRTTSPFGYSPCIMMGSTAREMAILMHENWPRIEPDMALMYAGRLIGGTGLVVDPCIALHQNIASTALSSRSYYEGTTKRFSPA